MDPVRWSLKVAVAATSGRFDDSDESGTETCSKLTDGTERVTKVALIHPLHPKGAVFWISICSLKHVRVFKMPELFDI